MREQIRKILNDPALAARYEKEFQRLRDFYAEPAPVPLWLGMQRMADVQSWAGVDATVYTDPEGFVDASMQRLAEMLTQTENPGFLSLPVVEYWLYGVHFVDKLFGAEVTCLKSSGQWNTLYLNTPIGTLQKPDLETNETWLLARRMAEAFLRWDVSGVIFKPQVIASLLNIAVNLYGAEILIAMIEEPENAAHDLRVITDTLMELHRWYREHIPAQQLQMICGGRTQPPYYGQICGCSTQLVSPELYEKFIMPLDDEVLGVYPEGGLIHLCGSHSHLIPLFARMKNLKNIQLNDRASEDMERYARGLRADQTLYVAPCEGMPVERIKELAKLHRTIIA